MPAEPEHKCDLPPTKAPCLVCGKSLGDYSHDYGDGNGNHPCGGLAFTTRGHYGSSVFDPMNNTGLAVNICDACVVAAQEQGRILWFSLQQVPSRDVYDLWTNIDDG